jgi:hypothetical protein
VHSWVLHSIVEARTIDIRRIAANRRDRSRGKGQLMTQNQSCLRFTIEHHVGWLEFNRPPVNAFTREMVDELHDAIAAALADPAVRVLVVASAISGYFSAGADLNVFKGIKADGMRAWATRCHDIVRLLRASPKPLLAAIHGTAVGGGLEITLHCDLRFAATDARLGQPEIPSASSHQSPPPRRWPAWSAGRAPSAISTTAAWCRRPRRCNGAWSTNWSSPPNCARGCRPMVRS